MFYLDPSLVVAALTAETRTKQAQDWLAQHSAEGFLLSAWTHVEVAAALDAKVRARQLEPDLRVEALAAYESIRAEQAAEILPAANHFRRAAAIAGDERAGLRGGDALHIAIAAEEDATLATMDQRQAQSAGEVGLAFVLV